MEVDTNPPVYTQEAHRLPRKLRSPGTPPVSQRVLVDLCESDDLVCGIENVQKDSSVNKDLPTCSQGDYERENIVVSEDVPVTVCDSPVNRGHYKSYSLRKKEEVVRYAGLHGVRQTSRTFKIPKSTIATWKTMTFTGDQVNKQGHRSKLGRPLTYGQDVEDRILAHVLEQRELQNPVTIEDLCIKARELVTTEHHSFKASRSWATKFMARNDLALWSKTSMAQRLPADLEDKIDSFGDFLRRQREHDEFEDAMIINMDETPVYFDIVPGKTIDNKGRKSIRVRTTGSDKRHLTVVLAVSAAGDVLPPMVVFKGIRDIKVPHPPGWIVCVQRKGWMDEQLMLRWVSEILVPHTKKDRALLVLDSFTAHKTDAVKKAMRKVNVVPAVIPGGCTSKLQPLDVSINKPFKVFYNYSTLLCLLVFIFW